MRKPESEQGRIPSPYDTTASKTERTAVANLMHWMRQIIERQNLDLGLPDVDTSGADRKSPDIVIYESRRSQNVLCVIEAKPPYYDVFNYEQLKKPAWEKANARRAKYFATTNFQELLWFNTEKVNAIRPTEEQVVDKYHLSELEDLNLIEEARYRESIIKQLEQFLTRLYAVYTGKEPEPKQAIDEFLIFRLHDKIKRLSRYYTAIIEDQCHKDKTFSLRLSRWFVDQGWSFAWQPHDFDKAARQTAYLLVNKILFYDLLQTKRPDKLDPLQIPLGLTKGAQFQKILQSFFDEVLKIDYETIYTTDFIDTIAFPEQKEVVKEVQELISILQEYDFSKLGYEIIGGIFQKLIPQDERHNLGQYFTNPDVVDLILCFCLKQENDKVFDPSCGAGTFLVRAYQHKKLMNQYLKHEVILETLWGNDIAKFPAHLSTINLAINDLSVDRNYPNIMQEDFFVLLTTDEGFDIPKKWRRVRAKTLGISEREIEYPRWFDCIVGNPPYTRQEEIAEIAPEDRRYKEKTIDNALKDINGRKIADISKRAGIYAYFFVHGAKFLRNGGRFGFIVSESWLDVDYGKGLQEFFLNHYKIIAIIGSKVERWFEDADINTCIVILEKCSGDDSRRERDDNLVRFVYLKKPLRYFIPPARDIWEKQVERINAIKDKFIKTVLAHSELYEGDDFRIFPKRQKELWEEGYDAELQKYTGAKWGKYLRAPDIFFRILEKDKDKLVPLKQIAEVRRGFTTGANEFFYLTEDEIKRLGIEQEFWMHTVLSPLTQDLSPLAPLNKGGTGGLVSPLNKGDTEGLDKTTLTARGLITTGFHLPYNPKLKQTARQLRKNMTPAEKKIWHGYFRAFKYPVLRQRPIDNYIVDFYCPEYRLIVEIDGESHFTEEGKVYDEERTKILEQYGLKIIRFLNEDVLKNLEGVVGKLETIMANLKKTIDNQANSSPTIHVWKDENGEYFKQSQYAKLYELKQVLQKDGCVYWLPNYVIKSPRECKSIVVKPLIRDGPMVGQM